MRARALACAVRGILSPEAQSCQDAFARFVREAAQAATIAANLRRLAGEYRRTERRAKTLENVLLPEVEETLKHVDEQLEASDQEELAQHAIAAPIGEREMMRAAAPETRRRPSDRTLAFGTIKQWMNPSAVASHIRLHGTLAVDIIRGAFNPPEDQHIFCFLPQNAGDSLIYFIRRVPAPTSARPPIQASMAKPIMRRAPAPSSTARPPIQASMAKPMNGKKTM